MGLKYKYGGLGFGCDIARAGSFWKWAVFSHGSLFASGKANTKKDAKRAVAEAKGRLRAQSHQFIPCIHVEDEEIRRLAILPLARIPGTWHRDIGCGDEVLLKAHWWYKAITHRKRIIRRFDLDRSSLVSLA